MSHRTHLAPFLTALVAVAGVFAYAEHTRSTPPVAPVPAAVAGIVHQATSAGAVAAPVVTSPRVPGAPAVTAMTTANAALMVGTTTYPVSVTPGETVIDAMRALVASSTFTFTGRDYPGLGFFVDSINGKENAGGLYWVLYINGVSSSLGASSVIVKAGDAVAWKYEKGY